MSKNLTRKGLALGALVALGSSVIAGAPAQAANELTFAPKLGTAFAMPITDTFTFAAGLPSGSTGNIAQLNYKVSTTGALTVNAVSAVKLANATVATSAKTANTASTGVKAVTSAAAAYVSGQADVVTAGTPDTHAYTVPTSTSQNTLAISLASAAVDSTTQTVVVTAFLDSDGSGTLNGTEWSTEQTVTFVKYSELTTSGTIVAPTAGDLKVTANWKFTNVNNEQITTTVKSAITKGDGVKLQSTSANDTVTAAAWDATDLFKVVNDGGASGTNWVAGSAGLAKNSAVKVQPILNATNVGTALTADVITRKVNTFTGSSVKSITADGAAGATTGAASGVAILKEFEVKFVAKDASTPTNLGVAGSAVTVSVSLPAVTLNTTTRSLTVNGVTYTSNASLPGASSTVAKIAATTDANGAVTLKVSTAGSSWANNDQIKFSAGVENYTADVFVKVQDLTYTGYIANAPVVYDSDATAAVLNTTEVSTVDGTGVTLDIRVKDQFGGNAPDNTYDVSALFNSGAGRGYSAQATAAATSASSNYTAVSAGKASLTITDNGTGIGTNSYEINLKTKASSGVYTASAAILDNLKINIVAAQDNAAGKVQLTATAGGTELGTASATDLTYVLQAYVNDGASSIAGKYGSKTGYATAAAAQTPVLAQLSTNEFGNYDSRDVYTTTPTETITGQNSGAPVTVNGTVKTASTATYADSPVENSKVTVSGAGLEFYVTGQGTLYGDGSLSFYADKDGQFTFLVASHLAGKQTVTVTSGAGTSKIYLYFAAAAVTAASKVDVKVADGAAQFQSGRALDVTFTVTDKYGNPITTPSTGTDAGVLTIGQTGAGYLANTGVVVTSATGVYSTKLITNAGDLGTSTITATVDLATDVVATNSSEFGITDVTDISSAGKAIYVNTEFAKGKVVTVYIDGKRMPVKAAEATDNAVERKYTQKKAGKHTVTVRVSGGVVASETVVTTK